MILYDFFRYYFQAVQPETLAIYQSLLPGQEDLAAAYQQVFSRNDEEAIAFLLDFHRASTRLREEHPDQAILFNVHDNVCFPFFMKYVWDILGDGDRSLLLARSKQNDLAGVIQALRQDVNLRNWFRGQLETRLGQEDLFTLNEIIALQNFSSGGESSFLEFAFPRLKDLRGRILDAGCGSGFASLVMSQYLDVFSVDACQARLERAMALSGMMKKGEKKTFPRVIKLIEEELGTMTVNYNFPGAETLLAGASREVRFSLGSIEKLDFSDGFFQAINCLDVLEHTYRPENIIAEFSRVLEKGGQVFITVPTRYGEVEQRIWESIEGTLFPAMLHMHHFEPATLSSLFSRHGLRQKEIVPFDFMTWDEFLEIAGRSPAREVAEELKAHPFERVALQLFAVYEKE